MHLRDRSINVLERVILGPLAFSALNAGMKCAFTAALLFFISAEALAETCGEVDADAKRLLASPAQRSDLLALKHIAQRAAQNSGCNGEYVYRLARILALAALSGLDEKAAAENRSLTSRELQPLSDISHPWQLMSALGDAYFAEKDWLKAFDAYDIALVNLNTGKTDERQVYGEVYAKAILARAFSTNDSPNDRSASRPNVPQFRTFRGGPAVDRAFLDEAVWSRVETSSDPRLLRAYLGEFPAGAHASAANKKLVDLAK
jgi:hypothetical protein